MPQASDPPVQVDSVLVLLLAPILLTPNTFSQYGFFPNYLGERGQILKSEPQNIEQGIMNIEGKTFIIRNSLRGVGSTSRRLCSIFDIRFSIPLDPRILLLYRFSDVYHFRVTTISAM